MCSYFLQQRARAKAQRLLDRGAEPLALDPTAPVEVIRPTTVAETLTAQGSRLRHWALIPFWSNTPKLKYATFNARAESLADKPSYRDAWKRSQRCLIPAVSYSEWPLINGQKARHDIRLADNRELMIAGLWSDWRCGDETRDTFTMITTGALESIAWVHHRTPLMLRPADWDQWLTGSADECTELLSPSEPGDLLVDIATYWSVSEST